MRRKIFGLAVLFMAVFIILIKLFTAEVVFDDDATILLVVRSTPSLSNSYATIENTDIIATFVSDENSYVGQGLYHALTAWLWLFFIPFFVVGIKLLMRHDESHITNK